MNFFHRHRGLTPYLLLGVVLWVCVLKSGVHATLAGVATGLMIPHVNTKNEIPDEIEHSPLESLEHALHPWVAYAILPLFAFANAGLVLRGLKPADMLAALPVGIAVGLVVGKPIGIVGAALGMRALGWARFPAGMDRRAMLGLGLLCGIGFTMSLFIASLAYRDPLLYEEAVLGVLGGLAIFLGIVVPALAFLDLVHARQQALFERHRALLDRLGVLSQLQQVAAPRAPHRPGS